MNEIFNSNGDLLTAIINLKETPSILIDFIDFSGTHKFTYFKNHTQLFNKLEDFKVNDHYYINEIIIDGTFRKPYLVLEKIYDNEKIYIDNKDILLKKLQKDIVIVFKEQYDETITKNDILLLESSGKVSNGFKMTFHIIIAPSNRTFYYTNSKFTHSSAYHLYTLLIDQDTSYIDLIDDQVYNRNVNLQIIESAKNFIDNRTLKPINKSINKLRYMLTYIDPNIKTIQLKTQIIQQSTKPKRVMIDEQIPQTNISNMLLKIVQKYHRSATYNGIYQDIYHNFYYTDRTEICPISGKSHNESTEFHIFETSKGYYLKCHSTTCPDTKHIGYIDESNDFLDNAIQINQQYLITDGAIDKKPNEEVKDRIKEWLSNPIIKTLAVKTATGTGKATMIKKILEFKKDSIKKILWITHRQTRTEQLYENFKSLQFRSYMNEEGCLINHDKIIVQIDNFMRISCYDEHLTFNRYDLVIIDEIEQCLNHFNSKYINEGRDIFDHLLVVIKYSKKLLILDADIGMRTNLFIKNFPKSIIINNNYSITQKTFVVMNSVEIFDKKLFDDIDSGKNVCIISMSSNAIDNITIKDKLVKKNIKHVMHTNKTDDRLKNELENVNSFWVKFQVVLYLSTIESDVDFNVKHFDKIYCVLTNDKMTCSQKDFLQMVERIRQFTDPTIFFYYDGPVHIDSPIYTFDDILSYCRYYDEINGRKMIKIADHKCIVKGDLVKGVKMDSYMLLHDYIMMYNETEILNKNPTIFITVLNSLIQRAGHNLQFDTIK